MIIYLEGASALYFANQRLGGAMFIITIQNEANLIGRNRILRNSIVGLALIVVAYSLSVSGWNGLSKYQNNLEQIEKFNTGKD